MTRVAVGVFLSGILAFGIHLAAKTGVRPSDFEVELASLRNELGALDTAAAKADRERPSDQRRAALTFRLASLTGLPEDYRAAEAAVADAIRISGPTQDLIFLRSGLEFKLHRLSEVARDLQAIRPMDPTSELIGMRGDLDFQLGKIAEARKAYESAIRKERNWASLSRLAFLESMVGDGKNADTLYAEASGSIRASEMRAYAWIELQRGYFSLRRGKFDAAKLHYAAAAKAYSGDWTVDDHLGELAAAEGRFDESVENFERAYSLARRPELAQAIGDVYLFRGDPRSAKPWHDRALAGYLDSVSRGEVQYYHHLSGFYADVIQDGNEAVKWAAQDLAMRPNYASFDAMAWAYYRAGRTQDAERAISRALESGVQDAHVFYHAGMIAQAAGRPDRGRAFFKKASDFNPRFETFHVHR